VQSGAERVMGTDLRRTAEPATSSSRSTPRYRQAGSGGEVYLPVDGGAHQFEK
jgi:hypothetical protein